MKRLKSNDELDSDIDKGVSKEWGVERDEDSSFNRSLSRRGFYYKSENGKKGLSSPSSRYDRLEDDCEGSRSFRKRPDYDVNSYDRRKSYDRYRDRGERVFSSSSPRGGYSADRIHRSESFSGLRIEFPKGCRSDRDRSRREGSVSSWRDGSVPSWRGFSAGKDIDESSRNGGDSTRGSRVPQDDVVEVRSPQGLRDAKLPVRKSEDLPLDSDNSSSEMEEGELEPDPEPVPVLREPLAKDQASVGLNPNQKERDREHLVGNKSSVDGAELSSEEKSQLNPLLICKEKVIVEQSEAVQDVVKESTELPSCQISLIHETNDCGNKRKTTSDNGSGKAEEESAPKSSSSKENVSNNTLVEDCQPFKEESEEDKHIDLEVKGEDIDLPAPTKRVAEGNDAYGVSEGNDAPGAPFSLGSEEITQNFKDKGKDVVISPCNGADSIGDSLRIESESKGFFTCREIDKDRPSTRGFDLFSADPVRKQQKVEQSGHSKPKDEKVSLEPLELSLSLPNVLLPIGGPQNTVQAPGSPSNVRSVHSFASSFRTNSDGFTASMSFSGSQSQPFSHNPSCSLTQNSYENFEQSVGSRPIFQGVDQAPPAVWLGDSSDDHKNKEFPMYQRILNGNGSARNSQPSQGISNGQAVELQHVRVAEGSTRMPIVLDRQLSFSKQLSGAQSKHPNDVRSPSQSVGSHENGPEHGRERKRVMRDKNGGNLYRSSNHDAKDQLLSGVDIVEPIITMIVSEPLHTMARRFNEMTAQSVACLKESVRDIILNPGKRRQLHSFQRTLQNRSDLSLDVLLKSHRSQLEILVALRTGLQDFLQRNYDITSSDMAEIFLNIRCRNLSCWNLLPVDECDCKICVQKNGFCSACMCLVCSKFDMASNTCSWVGCDVCLHWCHADCGLRESYIRNGHSAAGSQGTTEMQFHCVACDHPSEMFGFVKEVFQNFAKGWTAETLSKELEYVKRIFVTSEDVRGRQLHEIAAQMQSRLANKSDLQEVQSHMMRFFNESDSFKSNSTPVIPAKEVQKFTQGETSNGITRSSQEAAWLKSVYSEKAPQLEKPANSLPVFEYDRPDKPTTNSDLHKSSVKKEPYFDELESIVKIKQAEAKMFQARADDARREAEGLKRIAVTKNEKIEEEYTIRITKLHLSEAEETRRQKFEELQALERAHQEYFNLKMRMEADIRSLLLKMEATRQNLSL